MILGILMCEYEKQWVRARRFPRIDGNLVMDSSHMISTTEDGADPSAEPNQATNYLYWRQHGGDWFAEYNERKKVMPKYHIQELMLADYFAHSAPARVLEFGCGVGRHLSYLSKIAGIEPFGYDQSETMVQGCLNWTSPEWIEQRITIGQPVGRLPFPDKSFDIVFSAEVLVHVRPEDLDSILSEMIRISRWQVLHMETSPHYELVGGAHSGCWHHDLVAAYARLGRHCEILPTGFDMHTPHRVVLSQERALYNCPPVIPALLRRMEKDLDQGYQIHAQHVRNESAERMRTLEAMVYDRDQALQFKDHEVQVLHNELTGQIAALSEQLAQGQIREHELKGRLEQAQVAQREAEARKVHAEARKEESEQLLTRARVMQLDLARRISDLESAAAHQIATVAEQMARVTTQQKEAEALAAQTGAQRQAFLDQIGALEATVEQLRQSLTARERELLQQLYGAEVRLSSLEHAKNAQHAFIHDYLCEVRDELSREF